MGLLVHPPTEQDSLRWTHKIAAIFSIIESCRKLGVPVRQYLADTLPDLADRSIQSLAEISPTAYAANSAK